MNTGEPEVPRALEDAIAQLGEGTEEWHRAMAFYLFVMAARQWERADAAGRVARRRRRSAP